MFSVYYVACVSVFTVTEPAAVQTSLQQQQELCRPLCSGELGSGNDAADIDVCARHNSEVCFLGVFSYPILTCHFRKFLAPCSLVFCPSVVRQMHSASATQCTKLFVFYFVCQIVFLSMGLCSHDCLGGKTCKSPN